jgi:hypothetical protein
MKSRQLTLLVLAVSASACMSPPTAVCAAVAYSAIRVTAKDSVSGALLPNASLKAVGPYQTDSLNVGSNLGYYPVTLGWTAGTYAVSVQAPGYSEWARTETVTLSDPKCGVPNLVSVVALMQRSP